MLDPGQFDAQPDQVIEHAGVDVAGDDRGDDRVARHGPGGRAVQPGAAVPAALGGSGPAGGPPGGHLPDPLPGQHRPVIHRPQLGQRHVGPDLDRLPGPLGQQPGGHQAAHAVPA